MKILLINYDNREKSLAASYRMRKFSKFLRLAGHEVVAVCGAADVEDGSVKNIVPVPIKTSSSIVQRLYNRMIGWPDPSASWALKAFRHLEGQTYLNDIDVIISSSPPHGMQKLALYLSEQYKIPLVVDFRDDFITNHRTRWYTPLHKIAGAQLEKRLIRQARLAVLNTEIVRNRFIRRYPDAANKIITLTNGFDYDDFGEKLKIFDGNRAGPAKIVYVGSDYGGFAAKFISKIASQLKNDRIDDQWTIHTAGPGKWARSEPFPYWTHHGLLSQAAAVDLMCCGDVLLVLMPPGEREPSGTVPLKVYHYIRTCRTIVYFGESGSTTDILASVEGTSIFKRDEAGPFVRFLKSNKSTVCSYHMDRLNYIEKYNMRNISELLMQRITKALEEEKETDNGDACIIDHFS